MSLTRAWFFLAAAASVLSAAEFTVQTVDGLKRPIPGVDVDISCAPADPKPGGASEPFITLHYTSDRDGRVKGTYDASTCKPVTASISKEGYQTYMSGFRDTYVLPRPFTEQEIDRIVKLEGDDLLRGLRELLAGSGPMTDPIFHYEARLRPALRILASDPDVTVSVRFLLSMIAVPADLRLIVTLPPQPPGAFSTMWMWAAASSLVQPDSEEEWAFLEKCATVRLDTFWPRNGAVQTLRLTGGVRSEKILEEAGEKPRSLKSKPPVLTDRDLKVLASRVARALNVGKSRLASSPRFNEAGDKALIDLDFDNGNSIYTATFHRIDGVWMFRGARETSHPGF